MNLAKPILEVLKILPKDTICTVGIFSNKDGTKMCPLSHYLIQRGLINKKVFKDYANGKFSDKTLEMRKLLISYKEKFDYDLFDDLVKLRGFQKEAPIEVIIEVLTKMSIDQ